MITYIIENKEEQQIIAMAVTFAQSQSKKWGLFTKIARHLNDNGVKSRTGGQWTPQVTNKIFKRHIA